MTRTFSKIYGLAGARVGWMYGSSEIIDMVNRIGLTFPVASPSLQAAVASLDDISHQNRVYEINRRLRASFSTAMRALGLKVYPSQTNFVLLSFANSERSAADCDHYLRQAGYRYSAFRRGRLQRLHSRHHRLRSRYAGRAGCHQTVYGKLADDDQYRHQPVRAAISIR